MPSIPVIGFAGYSGSGKTTLLTRLIAELKQRGLHPAAIKHDAHGIEMDHEGKDTWLFTQAGADPVMISSDASAACLYSHSLSLWSMIRMIENQGKADLILVEGYKHEQLPRIGICRQATEKGYTDDPGCFIAVATDGPDPEPGVPCFALDDVSGIADFVTDFCRGGAGTQNQEDFTHFDEQGRARMVNVGDKEPSHRTAVAGARVLVSPETFELIRSGGMKKGDVLTVAQIAGIMGAKRTPQLIPMCHPILISGVKLKLTLDEVRCAVNIEAEVSCDGRTGVQMEALTAASTAALTVYDMCKAVQKDIEITDIRLLRKTGGVHGDFIRKE